MPKFKIQTPREQYIIEANYIERAILDREKIIFTELFDGEGLPIIHSQLDYPKTFLGFSKKYTIASDGCKVTSGTFLYNYFNGTNITPVEFNEMCKKGGAFFKSKYVDAACLLDDTIMAKIIGIKFVGRYTGIGEAPEDHGVITPTIKEVDYSIRPGKQQHFVVRVHDPAGNYILDPLGGVRRAINYYEKLVRDEQWKSKYFSYREFKK